MLVSGTLDEKTAYHPKLETELSLSAKAKEKGCISVIPLDDELTLDLDSGMQCKSNVLDVMARNGIGHKSTLTTISKSGHRHLWIKLFQTLDIPTRVALQSMLGSDPVREFLCLWRYRNNSPISIAMFEVEHQADAVLSWRVMLEIMDKENALNI